MSHLEYNPLIKRGLDLVGDGNSDTGFVPIVVSGNITAANDTSYTVVATSTITDPSPVEGKGYDVLVVNGTAMIGGFAYSISGTTIKRRFHSGSWVSFKYFSQGNSTIVTLIGDVSTTDSTNGAPIITFPMTVNKSYIVRGRLSISSGAAGSKFGTVYPSGTNPYYIIFGRTTNNQSFSTSGHTLTSGTFNAGVLNNVTGGSATGWGLLEGEVQCGATAGNLQITFAPVAPGQTSSILSLGTYIEIIEK